jgi:hypothetical protein
MTMRLDLVEDREGFSLGWFDPADDIEGELRIGEKIRVRKDEDGADHVYISEKLEKLCPPDYVQGEVFFWDSRTAGQRALRMARQLWKEWKSNKPWKPWPAWARKASAEGWKPPKGWEP